MDKEAEELRSAKGFETTEDLAQLVENFARLMEVESGLLRALKSAVVVYQSIPDEGQQIDKVINISLKQAQAAISKVEGNSNVP